MTAIPHELHDTLHTARTPSRAATITGRALSTIAVFLLAMDTAMKLLRVPQAVEGTVAMGFPVGMILPLGIISAVMLVLYAIPRTATFGAILWTGYLGGAVATHVRLGNPLWTHVLSPVYMAAVLWLGIWLRDARVRDVVPVRTPAAR